MSTHPTRAELTKLKVVSFIPAIRIQSKHVPHLNLRRNLGQGWRNLDSQLRGEKQC